MGQNIPFHADKMFRRGFLTLQLIVGSSILPSLLSDKPTVDSSAFPYGLFTAEAAVDAEKEKSNIERLFDKAQDLLARAKLQDLRGAIELLERKTDKIKGDISAQEASAYSARLDKVKKAATATEDSLVNKAYEILNEKGSDSALAYTGSELQLHGVSDKKISVAEKRILRDGPAIKQAKDQETIARLVKTLLNGETPDASTDRFLLQSAQRIVKAHTDSVKAIENEKNKKELEAQKRDEKARLEKEKKDKKIEEDRQAALKKEEEKKRQEEDITEKKRIAEEKERTKVMREAQEKARQDSLETARKSNEEKEALRREAARRLEETKLTMNRKVQEDENRQKKQAQQEKARRDSIEAQRKAQDDLARHQAEMRQMTQDDLKEKQRKADLEEDRQNKLLLKQQAERARKDSLEAYRKAQDAQLQQEKERRAQMARAEKERSRSKANDDNNASISSGKPDNGASEAERWGSIGGGVNQKNDQEEKREKERMAKMLEEERQKRNLRELQEVQRLAKQEKARQDSIEAQRKMQEQQDNQRRIAEDRKMKAQAEKERRLAEEQKRKEEQEERTQRIAEEKKMKAQAEKDRKLAEEQRKQEELENQRRITEERRAQALQEKERRVAAEVRERSSRSDDDRPVMAIGEDKTRKISVDASRPNMEQDEIKRLLENVRKEKDRLTRLEQQLQQQIADKQQQERARQDSIDNSASVRRASVAPPTSRRTKATVAQTTVQTEQSTPPSARATVRDDSDERRRILQNDDERRRQLLALQEKARIDYQKKLDEERVKLEKDRQRRMAARRESILSTPSGGKGLLNVKIDADAAKYDGGSSETSGQTSLYFSTPEEKPQPSASPVSSQRKEINTGKTTASTEQASPSAPGAKSQPTDWKSKEKRRRAEKFVADIYKLLEKNQVQKARQSFDANRDYITQYSDVEVSNILEQSIITAENAASKASSVQESAASSSSSETRSGSGYESQPKTPTSQSFYFSSSSSSRSSSARENASKAERPEPSIAKSEPAVSSADVNWEGNELEYISRINGYVRDNNGKAAYREFKKVEEQLKNYFTSEEFSHFKAMVENANRSGD